MRPWPKLPRLFGLACGLLLAAASSAWSDERILSYHGDIRLASDATITITETIRVRSEGNQIRRGIYRDFPTRYKDALGNHYQVRFDVLSVTREAQHEAWHTEPRANGVRLYVGSAHQMLPPGEHTYAITYRTDRSVGYFEDHDELYWNVTGTDWAFPIDQASARVVLPGRVPSSEMAVEGYTGPFGATGRDYIGATETSAATIRTARGLGPREGLTVVVSWPKGVVFEPDVVDRAGYLLMDNLGLLLALAVLLAVAGFLFFAWRRYGKDPVAGVTFAHYEPPDGYSPGAMRFVRKMGYDADTLAAAVVSLAVKGCLTIRNDADDYVLEAADSSTRVQLGEAVSAAPGEAALLDALFAESSRVVLDDENHVLIGRVRKAHKKALKRNYYKRYFQNNSQWLVPTFLGSIMAFAVLLSTDLVTPMVVGVFVLNGLMQLLFLVLLKAPTRRGRELMDKLDGFELYLKVAEKDDLNIKHPPELTPALFERYLPYAIALGVANEWARQFSAVLSRMTAAERSAYSPRWYRGNFHPHRLNRFVDDVGSSFSTAIASAATPPGSSSGSGGGGSSGGGGGGGGGGGW